jgi:hypothetical protein
MSPYCADAEKPVFRAAAGKSGSRRIVLGISPQYYAAASPAEAA